MEWNTKVCEQVLETKMQKYIEMKCITLVFDMLCFCEVRK